MTEERNRLINACEWLLVFWVPAPGTAGPSPAPGRIPCGVGERPSSLPTPPASPGLGGPVSNFISWLRLKISRSRPCPRFGGGAVETWPSPALAAPRSPLCAWSVAFATQKVMWWLCTRGHEAEGVPRGSGSPKKEPWGSWGCGEPRFGEQQAVGAALR